MISIDSFDDPATLGSSPASRGLEGARPQDRRRAPVARVDRQPSRLELYAGPGTDRLDDIPLAHGAEEPHELLIVTEVRPPLEKEWTRSTAALLELHRRTASHLVDDGVGRIGCEDGAGQPRRSSSLNFP